MMKAAAWAVFCLPGLSSSLTLASSLCVKSQAKQSSAARFKDPSRDTHTQPSGGVHSYRGSRTPALPGKYGKKQIERSCDIQPASRSVRRGSAAVPVFAPSTAAEQKPGEA